MNKKKLVLTVVSITIISVIGLSFNLFSISEKPPTINFNFNYDPGGQRINLETSIFNTYSYQEDWDLEKRKFNFVWVEKRIDYDYSEIESNNQNTVFIIPVFTNAAYWSPGFYDFYKNECDESCLITPLKNDLPLSYESSRNTMQILSLLGYNYLTDVEVAINPEILTSYDKIIILHNEYVTIEEFEAITNHPKVIYLYPNALYAQVEFDQKNNIITLIRGHGFPEKTITNGFNWKFDNTHPYEFDVECNDWEFYEINNGFMLNCYPENLILNNESLLIAIKKF